MLILLFFVQFKELDYQGLTPGVEALAMAGVPTAAAFSNPSSTFYNPACLSIFPWTMIRTERYLPRDCSEDTQQLPKYSISVFSPQLSFCYHPVVSFDETTTVDTNNVYEREHRRVNLTEFIFTMTSSTGAQLTRREHFYLGFNIKLYSGNFFSVKSTRIDNAWQEPEEMISSTLSPGVDVGVIFWYNKVTIGVMVQDAYTRISWKGYEKFVLPRTYRASLGVKPKKNIFLSGGVEYLDKDEGIWLPAGGGEFSLGDEERGLVFRGGIEYDAEPEEYYYSGGLGVYIKRFHIDGAVRYHDPEILFSLAVSLTG